MTAPAHASRMMPGASCPMPGSWVSQVPSGPYHWYEYLALFDAGRKEKGKAKGSQHGILHASKNPGRWVRRSAGMQARQSLISNTVAVMLPQESGLAWTSGGNATVGTVPRCDLRSIRCGYGC